HSRYSCQLVRSSTPLLGGLQAGELLGAPGGIDPAGIKVTIGKVFEGPTDPATGPHMMDNITINDRGQVLIQEDVGNNPYLGGVYQFDRASRAIGRIAQHDPNRFNARLIQRGGLHARHGLRRWRIPQSSQPWLLLPGRAWRRCRRCASRRGGQ
ncbi:MAG: hypothetical protein V7646_5849, partial [Pseudonocardia sp.]